MNIKIGDHVVVRMNGYTRSGKIDRISIGVDRLDIAGESGPEIDEYSLELNYHGAISYGDDYWAYFDQIMEVNDETV